MNSLGGALSRVRPTPLVTSHHLQDTTPSPAQVRKQLSECHKCVASPSTRVASPSIACGYPKDARRYLGPAHRFSRNARQTPTSFLAFFPLGPLPTASDLGFALRPATGWALIPKGFLGQRAAKKQRKQRLVVIFLFVTDSFVDRSNGNGGATSGLPTTACGFRILVFLWDSTVGIFRNNVCSGLGFGWGVGGA